ncbi:MAG: hypothetical protein KGZ83_08140 [Sulfuricella sp.]|nr:hypothetical protein [Sulfuricella sp.]
METSGLPPISFPPITGVQASAPVAPARRVGIGENGEAAQSSQVATREAEGGQQNKVAPQENQVKSETAPPSVGRIRFEMQDSTRVAQFFNTKDVLIYQVPPQGNLYLIKSQEASSQDQVETSA